MEELNINLWYLLLLIPVFVLELVLLIVALLDVVRRPRTKGPKWVWILIIVLINIFGPIAYLLFGREEEDAGDPD